MIDMRTYDDLGPAETGKAQTTRICSPHLIKLLQNECKRRGFVSLSSTAEQLLTERFMQIECLTDRGFMQVYGHKIQERDLVKEEVKKKLAAEVAIKVAEKTKDMQAEIDALRKSNESMSQMLSEWVSGKRTKMRMPSVKPSQPKTAEQLAEEEERERISLEEANRSLQEELEREEREAAKG